MDPAAPPPLILLRDPGLLPQERGRLARQGWTVQAGWDVGGDEFDVQSRRIVCWGEVGGENDRSAAVLAGVRGAGLLILVPPDGGDPGLIDELNRIAPDRRVEWRPVPLQQGLEGETIELLLVLAAGTTVARAAAQLNMALRTAHRRLGDAREAFGVTTNRQAIVEANRRFGSRAR